MADVKIRILSEDKTKAGLKSVDDNLASLVKNLGLAALAVTALKKGFDFVVESTKYAARVETLAVVTQTLGKNAGHTAAEIRALEKAIQDQGITTEASRQSLALMMQAELDLADATDLARLAQDAAVVAGIDSSQAFQRLVTVISTGSTRMARTMGLQVDFNAGYKAMAVELGKTVEELTAQEKAQSRANSVMAEGTQIAGAYDNAMQSVGKQLTSTKRHWDEYRKAVGETNIELLGYANLLVQKVLKAETERLKKLAELRTATELGIRDIEEYDGTMMGAIRTTMELSEITEGLTEEIEEETVRRENLAAMMEMENELRGEMIDMRSGEIEALAKQTARTELLAAAQEMTLETTTGLLDGINRKIDSPIEGFIKDLEWFIVTGGRIEEAFRNIQEAVGLGLITPEAGLAAARELLVLTEDIQEQMEKGGEGTFDIVWGDTLSEIAVELDTTVDAMMELNEQITDPNLIFAGESLATPFGEMVEFLAGDQGIIDSLERVDEIAGEAKGIRQFTDTLGDAHNELITMAGRTWDIDIRLNYITSGLKDDPSAGLVRTPTTTSTSGAQDMFTDKILERMGDLQ